jgi:uncharacterized protein (DUF433 family)
MNEPLNGQTTVIRNSLGLAIAETRITLYDIMDYLHEGWSPKLIQHWLDLTDEQMADVMVYLEQHRPDVEAEYADVVAYSEEVRHYWEERNKERLAQIAQLPPSPGKEALYQKLQTLKTRIAQG